MTAAYGVLAPARAKSPAYPANSAAGEEATYPKGVKVTDRQMRELEQRHITRHDFHGEWNYTIRPIGVPPGDSDTGS